MLDDNNLASDLNMLSLSKDGPGPSSSSAHPPSQPSSLPIYAPMSRSPLSPDRVSPYQPINLNIPSGTSYISRQRFSSPSDSGLSAGASPPRSQLEIMSCVTTPFFQSVSMVRRLVISDLLGGFAKVICYPPIYFDLC